MSGRFQSIRFLADVNVEKRIVESLRDAGHDVKWIPDYDCQLEDAELLDLANAEGRILITNDKDFGELFFLQKRLSQGIILFRIDGHNVMIKITLLRNILRKFADKLPKTFVVISRKRIRFIPMEDK
jgi:predicted nuclease of predicted toxin-antitoxin system